MTPGPHFPPPASQLPVPAYHWPDRPSWWCTPRRHIGSCGLFLWVPLLQWISLSINLHDSIRLVRLVLYRNPKVKPGSNQYSSSSEAEFETHWWIIGLTSLPLTCFLLWHYGFLWFLAHFSNQTTQLWYSSLALVHKDPVFQRTVSPQGQGLILCLSMSGWYCTVHPAGLYLNSRAKTGHLSSSGKTDSWICSCKFLSYSCKHLS